MIMLLAWQVVKVDTEIVLVEKVVLVVDVVEVDATQTETTAPVLSMAEHVRPEQQPVYWLVIALPATCTPVHDERVVD